MSRNIAVNILIAVAVIGCGYPDTRIVRGRDGTNGERGEAGEKGDTVVGPKGDNGESIVGPKGDQGEQGTNGVNGTNGTNGLNGVDGIDGKDGTNGIDGVNGTNGINGRDGTNGADGADGADGKDAIITVIDPCGDTPNIIDEVLLVMSDGKILASFSENVEGRNTRFVLVPDGTFITTDGSRCVFTIKEGKVL